MLFLHLDLTSQASTESTMALRLSGSDFMMASNSEYLPGRKNTRVTPNL